MGSCVDLPLLLFVWWSLDVLSLSRVTPPKKRPSRQFTLNSYSLAPVVTPNAIVSQLQSSAALGRAVVCRESQTCGVSGISNLPRLINVCRGLDRPPSCCGSAEFLILL